MNMKYNHSIWQCVGFEISFLSISGLFMFLNHFFQLLLLILIYHPVFIEIDREIPYIIFSLFILYFIIGLHTLKYQLFYVLMHFLCSQYTLYIPIRFWFKFYIIMRDDFIYCIRTLLDYPIWLEHSPFIKCVYAQFSLW